MTYVEVLSQPYDNCIISAGITDHPIDTIYLKFSRPPEDDILIVLRPDEALALAWLMSGVCWSIEIQKIAESED